MAARPEARLDGRSCLAGMAAQSHVVCCAGVIAQPCATAAMERIDQRPPRFLRRNGCSSRPYAMASSFRFPFMDWDLVMFALSIPSRYWPPPWPFERLHRTALADMLPAAINRREGKANATHALANRVSRQLPTIRRLFDSPGWLAGRYVRSRLWPRKPWPHSKRRRHLPSGALGRVWGIATLEAWLRAVSRYTPPPRREA